MILDERKADILDFIVRDYIKRGEPVASGRVYENAIIDAAPATIRNIMCELDESGFLEQLHISGGRIPTDKAYRYFVDSLMDVKTPRRRDQEAFEEMARSTRSLHDINYQMGKVISEATNLFTIIASFGGKKHLDYYGAEGLLAEPEFDNRQILRDFARLIDGAYEAADVYRQEMNEAEEVFIGKENPVREVENFSVLSARWQDGDGETVMLAVGPKRMDYEYGYSVIRYFLADNQKHHG
ncbi:MAG: hypothetical protein AAB378_00335 [Patescibacteria group bacterium]